MPNWKTYESSVRLLSAIVAAHPELKLNYADIANYYGGGSGYKSIWGRMTVIRGHADALRGAFDQGIDPDTIELKDSALGVAPKKQGMSPKKRATPKKIAKEEYDYDAISDAFGGDCTRSAIENRFRKIKSHAVLINKAVARGVDPFTLPVGDKGSDASGSKGGDEIAAFMGSDVTPNGLRFQFTDRFRPLAKKQTAMKNGGLDPKDADLGSDPKATPKGKASASKDVISKHFGSDSTGGGIEFQFRKIKSEAKRQRACVSSGGDPLSLGIGSGGGTDAIAHFLPDTTSTALQHVFRPIKKDALKLIAEFGPATNRDGGGGGSAISANYGEGTTPKAISTYFERARKDPHSNLSNSTEENGRAVPGSGSKAGSARKRAAPASGTKKRASKASKGDLDEEDDPTLDDNSDDSVEETPSKKSKTGLNKVKGARVTKPRVSRPNPGAFVEQDDEENDLESETVYGNPTPKSPISVKKERGVQSQNNGSGTNGHAPGGAGDASIPHYYTNGVAFPSNGNGYSVAHASFASHDQSGDYSDVHEDDGGS